MEIVNIKKDNIATYGLSLWEQVGTIAIDFANYLDKLQAIKDIDLSKYFIEGWTQVGFKFSNSLIENKDRLDIGIVLSRKKTDGSFEYGIVKRTISKNDFIGLIVHVTAQVSNSEHFQNDKINWSDLKEL